VFIFGSDVREHFIARIWRLGWRFFEDPAHVSTLTRRLVDLEGGDVSAFLVEEAEMETAEGSVGVCGVPGK
jgi:hypothetical protein